MRGATRALSSRRQVALLLGLFWKHVRRRPARLGATPKLSGVPTFLLLNLISLGYLAPLIWRNVSKDVEQMPGVLVWHFAGIALLGIGYGVTASASAFQLQGMRNDAFLDALPLTTAARLGLQITDGVFVMLLTPVVGLAGLSALPSLARGAAWAGALSCPLGYVACFVVGNAAVAWARALGPPSIARRCGFAGIGLTLSGFVLLVAPLATILVEGEGRADGPAQPFVVDGAGVAASYATALLVTGLAYGALQRAQRLGFDHLPPQRSTPRALSGAPTRQRLEWHMMMRQGSGLAALAISVSLLFFWRLFLRLDNPAAIRVVVPMVAGLSVYLGAIMVIGYAGRAARADLAARPFLSALPLSPHDVTDGKARALRKLLPPVLLTLAALSGLCAWYGEIGWAYRTLLAMLASYVVVDGAVSIAFLSHGVGVAGAGGQVSSSFSTQLLMIPLLATVFAMDQWAASVAFIAVAAVTWEAKRAAARSVRWLDDPDDDVERETTVWRALLAATAFFAVQTMGFRLLQLFEVPSGYTLTIAFAASAFLLVLLTLRNAERFERPRFRPSASVFWPLGALAGAASGSIARSFGSLLKPTVEAQAVSFTTGEAVCVFVTLVLLAPWAEEYFFRGWLQRAIQRDLPARFTRFAFVPGACAFALAHVGTYGVPQLVLGLFAGALYDAGGGLLPAILAHAVHNALVLLWPP